MTVGSFQRWLGNVLLFCIIVMGIDDLVGVYRPTQQMLEPENLNVFITGKQFRLAAKFKTELPT
jgi:hypothetical protein